MEIAAESLDASAAYRLLVEIVVPRPIAWITTVSPAGLVNAAPFSCYTFVCNDPPMLAINIGRRDGELKDTARDIDESGEFVVNVVSEDLVEAMTPPQPNATRSLAKSMHFGSTSPPAGSYEPRVCALSGQP